MDDENYDYISKVIIIGDTGVGKTNIISRFVKGEFIEKSCATVSCEFSSKLIIASGKRIKLQIWDTAGQERYRSLTKGYFHNATGVVVVFDITKYSSFQNVSSWIDDVRETLSDKVPLIILGNKCDMANKDDVKVQQFEVVSLCKKYGKLHFNFKIVNILLPQLY